MQLVLVEDNLSLRKALKKGFEAFNGVSIPFEFDSGESLLAFKFETDPDVVLMDVALSGVINGIQTMVALRRELPRLPVVFYSIQDDDQYYRDFLNSGILTHYAYVKKSNFLLPESILPLLEDAVAGKSFIDAEIAQRVDEVRQKDANDPLSLLEPNEKEVIKLVAAGFTNEQIAKKLNLHDARAVSRTNGQIYAAWGLNATTQDEKVARTRAAMIFLRREMITWDNEGEAFIMTADGHWKKLE